MNCSRCGKWIGGDFTCHVGNTIYLCGSCGPDWEASPEAKRLKAITTSVYSEWIERLRCEALSEAEQKKTEAPAAPTAAPTEGHKS